VAAWKITDVRATVTAPGGINLVVVRVDTTEPGLHGLGCATFAWRAHAVRQVVEHDLAPLVRGRDPHRIEDLWASLHTSAYWRNGPVLNNALAGIDMALWDLKGKRAGLPVYELLGGRCRDTVPVYLHAGGRSPEEVEASARRALKRGVGHVRCQLDGYGGPARARALGETDLPGRYYDPATYARAVPRLFEHLRGALGEDVELLHDVHERLAPADAVRLAKDLEPFRLFFLEDLVPPEHSEWLAAVRTQCATPQAMGELFTHPREWRTLLSERWIDFIRVHLSHIGGITPARKLAHACEAWGVRTAWHGPPDCSPIGHAANLHLDVSTPNFGIQEWSDPPEAVREVFPGAPLLEAGGVRPGDRPGLGVEMDERRAAAFPPVEVDCGWMRPRLPDGTSAWP
jgi:mannonate dehydratase